MAGFAVFDRIRQPLNWHKGLFPLTNNVSPSSSIQNYTLCGLVTKQLMMIVFTVRSSLHVT